MQYLKCKSQNLNQLTLSPNTHSPYKKQHYTFRGLFHNRSKSIYKINTKFYFFYSQVVKPLNIVVVTCPIHAIFQGIKHRIVKHMHVLAWPDHGCPHTTDLVLQFCLAVRHHMPRTPHGPIVVHCRYNMEKERGAALVDQPLLILRYWPVFISFNFAVN